MINAWKKMTTCLRRSTSKTVFEASITSRPAPGYSCLFPLSEVSGNTFSGKAEQKGVELSELVTDILKRDIEITEALK